jgi:hypothetical protein
LGEAPVLALMGRVSVLFNDAELFEDDGPWRVEGDPTKGALRGGPGCLNGFSASISVANSASPVVSPRHYVLPKLRNYEARAILLPILLLYSLRHVRFAHRAAYRVARTAVTRSLPTGAFLRFRSSNHLVLIAAIEPMSSNQADASALGAQRTHCQRTKA